MPTSQQCRSTKWNWKHRLLNHVKSLTDSSIPFHSSSTATILREMVTRAAPFTLHGTQTSTKLRHRPNWASLYSDPRSQLDIRGCFAKRKVKCATHHKECTRGAHLPSLGLEPVGDKPQKPATHGQCDARPTVTFPAAGHHRPLTGTNLLLGDMCVNNLPKVVT